MRTLVIFLGGVFFTLVVQSIVILSAGEFYLHVAPNDNMVQYDGTIIELKGLGGILTGEVSGQ